jgi:hypothetical protein
MAITIEGINDKGVVLTSSGIVTGAELVQVCGSLVTEHNSGLQYAVVDLTNMDEVHASRDELLAVADKNKLLAAIAHPRMRVAVAAPHDLAFGLSSMCKAFMSRDTGWQIAVFRSRADANSWSDYRVNFFLRRHEAAQANQR